MNALATKTSLSAGRRRLVELMQDVGFGCIEGLAVRSGDPVLTPLPRVVRERKFPGENGPRPERSVADFLLKAQVIELFCYFDEIGNGTIDTLEIKHGLPFRTFVVEAGA